VICGILVVTIHRCQRSRCPKGSAARHRRDPAGE